MTFFYCTAVSPTLAASARAEDEIISAKSHIAELETRLAESLSSQNKEVLALVAGNARMHIYSQPAPLFPISTACVQMVSF